MGQSGIAFDSLYEALLKMAKQRDEEQLQAVFVLLGPINGSAAEGLEFIECHILEELRPLARAEAIGKFLEETKIEKLATLRYLLQQVRDASKKLSNSDS